MTDKPQRKIMGIPLWALFIAVLAGLMVGSFDRIRLFLSDDGTGETASAASPAEAGPGESTGLPLARELPATAAQAHASSTATRSPRRDDVQIRVDDGLLFEPAVQQGLFVGYRVITNRDDPRFAVGDIVTAIGGNPVEDSPAGGELLAAGLMNRAAEVQVLSPADTRQQ